MLGKTLTWFGLCCLALCACDKTKAPEPAACGADAGCADASVCTGDGGCDVAWEPAAAAGSGARGTRVQTVSRQADAGQLVEDAAPARRSEPQAARGGSGGRETPPAGAPAPMTEPMMDPEPMMEQEPDRAASDAGEPAAECDEQSCGPCQACGESNSCEAVTGRDDADSCSDSRSCGSRGTCLHVSEAHTDLGTMTDYAELTTSYAQVITFSEPASIVEIRLEVSCNENDQSFPAVWLAAAPSGIPTDTIIATANVLYQEPSDTNTFALLELSKVLEQPETGPIAIVVSQTEMSCIIRLNTEEPYADGRLFSQGAADLWLPAEGSMVFQVLSSQ